MASWWNLWVWLECIGVVIIITFAFSTCISSYLPAASLFLCSFLTVFCFCINISSTTTNYHNFYCLYMFITVILN